MCYPLFFIYFWSFMSLHLLRAIRLEGRERERTGRRCSGPWGCLSLALRVCLPFSQTLVCSFCHWSAQICVVVIVAVRLPQQFRTEYLTDRSFSPHRNMASVSSPVRVVSWTDAVDEEQEVPIVVIEAPADPPQPSGGRRPSQTSGCMRTLL